MTDVLTPRQRSYNMSRIRSRDTEPEKILRHELWRSGIRGYRVRYPLKGRPDIVFPREKVAVFVDGCFWHGCPICYKEPETRKMFWRRKIAGNIRRDSQVTAFLESSGWCVVRIWEHEIRKSPPSAAAAVAAATGRTR